jgi:hypothetical protein
MFARYKQHSAPIAKAGVDTIVDAASMSACATMISIIYAAPGLVASGLPIFQHPC